MWRSQTSSSFSHMSVYPTIFHYFFETFIISSTEPNLLICFLILFEPDSIPTNNSLHLDCVNLQILSKSLAKDNRCKPYDDT